MNYGYGPAAAGPYNPYMTGWGGYGGNFGFGGGFGYPYGGYGTFPATPLAGLTGAAWSPANDDEIKYFVENTLDNDPEIPAHVNLGVDVNNGVVTLSGTVPNKRIKHAAGDDAWWLPQVLDVHNVINVKTRRERVSETGGAGRRTQTGGR